MPLGGFRTNAPEEWEYITIRTYRLAIPNGWIVKVERCNSVNYGYCSMIFIEDKYHTWDLNHDYSAPTEHFNTGPK